MRVCRIPRLHQMPSSRGLPSVMCPHEARHMRGAEAAAKARAKRYETVAQSQTRPRQGRDEHLPPVRKSGIMLVRVQDQEARRKAQQLKLPLTSAPLDFVDKVVKVPARPQKVHVVLAHLVDTDFR